MSRNLLEESQLKQGRFCDSSKGRWEKRDFQPFPQYINNECDQRKSWLVGLKIIIVSSLAAMMTDQVYLE